MEKEFTIEIVKEKTTDKEITVNFPVYVRHDYHNNYQAVKYLKYLSKQTAIQITLPKDLQQENKNGYFSLDITTGTYDYFLSKAFSNSTDYTKTITEEEFLTAFNLYKQEFVNKI